MGQLPFESESVINSNPHELSTTKCIEFPYFLPPISVEPLIAIREVWCGSEYTIASDADGYLWGCGWSEHGNLSCQYLRSSKVCDEETTSLPLYVKQWSHVVEEAASSMITASNDVASGMKQVQLSEVSEVSLSCGGAHCLAFIK